MRQLKLLFLGTVARATVAAGSSIRGVSPEFAKYYTNKKTFTCVTQPSIILKSSQVNDESCDCPDGSDEPGTAACGNLDPLSPEQPLAGSITGTTNLTTALPGFWCANVGHIGHYIPFRLVNDGVCDYELCCDGSEEYGRVRGVKCENRCAFIGKEYRRLEEEKQKAKEKALKRRRTLVKESKELRRRTEARIAALKEEIKGLEEKRDELKKKLEEVEKSERGKVIKSEGQGGKLGVLVGLAKNRVKELRDALDKMVDQRDDLQDKVDELENILKKFREEYNPNFNDAGVKAAAQSWDDYVAKQIEKKKPEVNDGDVLEILKEDSETTGINWKEFEEEGTADTDVLYNLEAYLPEFMRGYFYSKLNLLRIWMIEHGMMANNHSGSSESRLVTAAREAFQEAENQVSTKEKSLADEQGDLEKDYGLEGIFRTLKGKCVSMNSGEYEYELCWLSQTTQKSRKGHGHTNIGNFERIDREISDEEDRADEKSLGKGERIVMRYDNGQNCWNGPNRRTDVWLACSETEEIWRVTEAEKCVYKMEVGTPAACEEKQEQAPQDKDEL